MTILLKTSFKQVSKMFEVLDQIHMYCKTSRFEGKSCDLKVQSLETEQTVTSSLTEKIIYLFLNAS